MDAEPSPKKDYEKIEGFDKLTYDLSMKNPDFRKSIIKKPRLIRERFRSKGSRYKYLTYKTYREPSESYKIEHGVYVSTYKRDADLEFTLDSIRNSLFVDKTPKEVFKDDGGKFLHSIISWSDTSVPFSRSFDGETEAYDLRSQFYTLPTDAEDEHIIIRDTVDIFPSDIDISDIGPFLWKQMAPARPAVDLGLDIIEIGDLPLLLKGRLDSIKAVSNFHLAVNFGWLPLYSDIKKMIKLYHNIGARLKFLKDNVGKPLHRSVKLKPKVVDSELYRFEGDSGSWLSWDYTANGNDITEERAVVNTLKLHKEVTDSASGRFIFFFDGKVPGDELLRARLEGLILSPRVIWEAMPWSFLIDWFANVGDVIANATADIASRQVSLYAYSQRHTVREYTWASTNGYVSSNTKRVFDTKVRDYINPFGLALQDGLTDLQSSILAALFITRW